MWNLSGSGRDEEPQINHLQTALQGRQEEDLLLVPLQVLFLSRCSSSFWIGKKVSAGKLSSLHKE